MTRASNLLASGKGAFVASLVVLLSSTSAFALDLTGVWDGNDGGTYYVRQIGRVVTWYGENDPDGPTFSNVARGPLNPAGNQIRLVWTDVPKGLTLNNGQLVVRVVSDTQLAVLRATGGFGGTVFLKEPPGSRRHSLRNGQK